MSKVYWYEYRLRGAAPGCQPDDFVELDHSYGGYGKVAYNRKLSQSEIDNYDLLDLNKSKLEIAYNELLQKLIGEGNMKEINADNMLLMIRYIDELERERNMA